MTRVVDRYVVDTGVLVRWFLPQAGWEHAEEVRDQFLRGDVALSTVSSCLVEMAHVLRTKGLLTGKLDRSRYVGASRAVDDVGVVVHDTDADARERAAGLAADRGLRFFDALVVDRAVREGVPLLTTDAKLCRAVAGVLSTELLRGVGGPRSEP